jgi:hypothetical protein
VDRAYQDLFSRPAEPGGLGHWSGLADAGTPLDNVVQGILTSPYEYHTYLAQGLYRDWLGREADPDGFYFWVTSLHQGLSVEQFQAGFMGSPEYFSRAGGTDDAFLTAAYRDGLGRPIDPSGQSYYGGLLAQGEARPLVAFSILTSLEAHQGLVSTVYAEFLRRPAEPSGFQFWVTALEQGRLQHQGLIAEIIGSPEYAAMPCTMTAGGSAGGGSGGSRGGGGTALLLKEGTSLDSRATRTITIPSRPSKLTFTYTGPSFDATAPGSISNAFEASLLGPDGKTLVHPFAPDRDAFFNVGEGQPAAAGAGTTVSGRTVTTDLSGLAAGTQATLVFRLVSSDGDTGSSVRITGVKVVPGGQGTPPQAVVASPARSTPRAFDFSQLSDVSASFKGEYGRTSYDEGTGVLYADVAVRDEGQYLVDAPLLVGITHLSDPSVRPLNTDGVTPDGVPYYDFSDVVSGSTLRPGDVTGSRTLSFYNPNRVTFSYDLVVLGQLNSPPAFTSQPNTEGITGVPYVYQATATDPDHDALTYSLLSGPHGMTVDAATGKVAWAPGTGDVGTQAVALRADDGRGGTAEQDFNVSVVDPPPNQPPVFTSTPVVDANVNVPYTYQATARDADGDPLTFSVVNSPAGLNIDPASGLVSWTPAGDQVGNTNVTLQVSDGRGGTATQPYIIAV